MIPHPIELLARGRAGNVAVVDIQIIAGFLQRPDMIVPCMDEAETIYEVPTPEFDRLCESCGYNLRGLPENRCPECGTIFNPDQLPLANVPWLHRAQIGLIKAYCATIWQVTIRPATFARAFDWPARINRADGRKFKSITMWIAVASFVAIPICQAAIDAIARNRVRSYPQIINLTMLMIGAVVFLQIFFRLATAISLTTRSFPKNHLAQVEDYAAAPLVPFGLAIFAPTLMAQLLSATGQGWAIDRLGAAVVFAWVVLGIFLWISMARLTASAGCLPRGLALRMTLFLPFHWFGSLVAAMAAAMPILAILMFFG